MKTPRLINELLRAFLRRRVSLLLFAATVLFGTRVFADALDANGGALQWGTIILSGILLPMLWSFRKETRDARHALREQVQGELGRLAERVQQIALSIARLEERDRISEMLDKRLPKA